jgi:hypothetical protein
VFFTDTWKWGGLTCGQGGTPERPLFVDKHGSDDNHPICISVHGPPAPSYDDYIRIDADSIAAGTIGAEIPFYVSRTCPYDELIPTHVSGFVMTATGDAGWSFSDYSAGPSVYDWFPTGTAGVLINGIDGTPPDTFVVQSLTWLPDGMPVTTEELLFTLYLDIGPGTGEICIDSSFVPSTFAWKFSGLECGQGGAPDRPLFVAKDSSDADHPVRIKIFQPICGDANLSGSVDIDDAVFLIYCIFLQGTAPNPAVIADVDCSGGVDIDDAVYLLLFAIGSGPEPCAECP